MIVRYWRYEEGRQVGLPSSLYTIPKGWYGAIWTREGDIDIEQWMKQNFTGKYDMDFRFNSGDPCYYFHIKNEDDAMLFKLTFADCIQESRYGM